METRLYIGNLPYRTTEDELRELFGQAGNIVSVSVVIDRDTGRSRGFGFVEMSNPAEAEKAISMFDRYELHNRPLTVNLAKPRPDRAPAGGTEGRGSRSPR